MAYKVLDVSTLIVVWGCFRLNTLYRAVERGVGLKPNGLLTYKRPN